ncbi:putative ribonuclease H-like domain-containing protein [Tanacetum coccineum]
MLLGNGHQQDILNLPFYFNSLNFCSSYWLKFPFGITFQTSLLMYSREYKSKGNQESRRRDAGNTGYKAKDNGRRSGKQEEPKALVTLDRDGVDWTGHVEDEQENFALMAHSNSGTNTEVTSCSKECEESYAKLKKLYDEQREQLGVASIEIQAYTQALKKMSTRYKSRLGYGNQIHEGVLSYEKEVLKSVFDSRSSDVEDSPVNDRFAKVEGMHVVPLPMTGIYMPSKSDFRIDDSKFTYGPKQSKTSESDAKTSDTASCESNSSVETSDSVPKLAVNEPITVSKSKVWSDAPIIEEYKSDSDDEYVIEPSKEQEKPSFAFVNTVKHVKTLREILKEQNTYSPSPKADKRDWNGLMSKKLGLGYGFTKKACFVCGSFSHLIRDCDFHEKRMAKQVELNKQKGKGTGQGENKPVWNNLQRLNHLNKFVPKALLTKIGIFLVNVARQNPSSQAAETSIARKDNPQKALKNKRIVDSGCSKHMTGNKAYLIYLSNHYWAEAGNSEMEAEPAQEYFVLPLWYSYTSTVKSSDAKNRYEKPNEDTGLKTNEEPKEQEDQAFLEELKRQEKEASDATKAFRKEFAQCTENLLLQEGAARATSTNSVDTISTPISTASPSRVFSTGGPDLTNNDQDDSQIPALEDIYDNPSDGIFSNASYNDEGAVTDFTNLETTVNVSPIPTSRIHSIHPITQILGDPASAVQTRSKVNKSSEAHAFIEPKKISQALKDESWVDAMQEELLQFKIQQVWILVDLPFGKKAIGTKWVYRNKKDERGVVVRNMVRIKAIRIFLAFASYMGFIVYQMDVKSAFLYGTIDEKVCVSQPPGFVDLKFPKKDSYKVKSSVHQKEDGIFIRQEKYAVEILKKFDFDSVKTANTPIETRKPLVKDEEATDWICSRFQVTPKISHLYAVKRIFSDYARANLNRKSITGGCQFFGRRLISWQCKKQTIVSTSTIEAEYVAAANCWEHVPLFDTMLLHDQPGQGEGPKLSVESQHTPTASSPSTSQLTTSQPTSSQAHSSHEPTTEPIITTSSPHPQETQILRTTSSIPHDSPLLGGYIPGSVEGRMKLKELTDLCTKLVAKVTNLETELKKTKEVHGKALTKLVKKVKRLEYELKSTNKRKKSKLVIPDEEELVLEDPSKQGRIEETEYADVKVQSQETFEAELRVLSAAKILAEASKERVKTYNRRRGSTDSSQVSTVVGLVSTAKDIQE